MAGRGNRWTDGRGLMKSHVWFWLALAAAAFGGCVSVLSDGGSFRIMSYNIRHGEGMDGRLDIERIGRRIAEASPRFAGLQEVDMKTARVGGADTCAVLERTTGLHATFARAIAYGGGEYGNALLSREAPKAVRRIPLPGCEPRVLLLCEFDDCWVGVMHLDVRSPEAHMSSLSVIEAAVAACGPKPVFLTGDWNASPDSPVLDGMRKFATVLSDERGATFHNGNTDAAWLGNAKYCIDYIAVDSAHRADYGVCGARTVPDFRSSDHSPIVVEVERRGAL